MSEVTFEQVKAVADEKGRVVRLGADPRYAAVDCGPAPDTNERMRMTSDGALLLVDGGRYWQLGLLSEVYNGLRSLA